MLRLNNLSDQLGLYAEEVNAIITKFKDDGLTFNKAAKVVEIATKVQLVDSVYHLLNKEGRLEIDLDGGLSFNTDSDIGLGGEITLINHLLPEDQLKVYANVGGAVDIINHYEEDDKNKRKKK